MSQKAKEREVFFEAMEIENVAQRQLFLDQACQGDQKFRKKIDDLLLANASETEMLIDQPLFPSMSEDSPAMSQVGQSVSSGDHLGPYELTNLLGQGGMGEVWAAKQSAPIRRQVAIKLIRSGFETPGILLRFNQERQALAAMDHPGIAKVLDAGATADNRPYFVMEWVEGESLIQFCDTAGLGITQRLQIFVQITEAVQHAHQKAIIHRDLKPTNILVATIDGRPFPKVIDFGLAKALSPDLFDDTVNTQFGVAMGTLQYMSPEQADFGKQDIDTRADIYSLGVVLYELLTGTCPLTHERLSDATIKEKLAIVKDERPQRPSRRLMNSNASAKIAGDRNSNPKQLSGILEQELDWIVMQALEKDRELRYQSAREFGADVARFLNGEPVLAHPPSRLYLAKKYVQKNLGTVLSLATIVAALVAGIFGTSYGLYQANENANRLEKEVERATTAEATAERKQQDAEIARKRELQQQKYSAAIAEFLSEDFLELTSWQGRLGLLRDPYSPIVSKDRLDGDATLVDLLRRAAKRLTQRKDLDPAVSAHLHQVIGRSFSERSDYEDAIPLLKKSIALANGKTPAGFSTLVNAKNALVNSLEQSGRLGEAKETSQEIATLLGNQFGTESRHAIIASLQTGSISLLQRDYGEAEKIFTAGIAKLKAQDENDQAIPVYLSYLGQALENLGHADKGIAATHEALELARRQWTDDHPEVLAIMQKLAHMQYHAGHLEASIELTKEILERMPTGDEVDLIDKRTVLEIRDYALTELSRTGEAEATRQQLFTINQELLNEKFENSVRLDAANKLGIVYMRDRQNESALKMFKLAHELLQQEDTADRPMEAAILNGWGRTLYRMQKYEESVPILEKSVELSKREDGEISPQTSSFLGLLALAYRNVGKAERAVEILEEVVELRTNQYGEKSPATIATMSNLAILCQDIGKTDRSIELLRKVIKIQKTVFNSDAHPKILYSQNNLASVLQRSGQNEEAIDLYQSSYDAMKKDAESSDKDRLHTQALLLGAKAAAAGSEGDWAGAIEHQQDSVDVFRQLLPDHWKVASAQVELGRYQKMYDQPKLATKTLELAYEKLKENQAALTLPGFQQLRSTANLLLELAEQADDTDAVDRWKSIAEKLDDNP